MDGAWGRRREDVDASAEDVVAEIMVRAEAVGERSRGEVSGRGRAELGEPYGLLVLARSGCCGTSATEVSILREDVMTAK
jgi:hypothetical protein